MWLRRPQPRHCHSVGEALAGCIWPAAISRSAAPMRSGPPAGGRCSSASATAPTRSRRGSPRPSSASSTHCSPHWPRDLPAGVIHADLFPDNVFFLGDELSGLIDFYFACNDALAYDIADLPQRLVLRARRLRFNRDKGAALLEGYQSVRALDRRRARALPMLARGAALRFLLTRAYDWLNTPADALVVKPHDPIDYLQAAALPPGVVADGSAAAYGLE